MYIKSQDSFGDGDLNHLEELLAIIDTKLSSITEMAQLSVDPETDGLFDAGEYFIGVAFAAIQRYIASTHGQFKITRCKALRLPPMITDSLTFVEALNAAANFWKHSEEWGIRNNVVRNVDNLCTSAQHTIKAMEKITAWDDYTLSNLLASLTPSGKLHLVELVPKLIEWRASLDALNCDIS